MKNEGGKKFKRTGQREAHQGREARHAHQYFLLTPLLTSRSQTARHLAEFWMLEPEMAFTEKDGAMDNVENMLKFVIGRAMEDCDEDLTFFDKFYEKGLKDRLKKIQEQDFVRLSYRDAVQMLQEEIKKDPSAWQFPEVVFGTDLQTEHERWLCEVRWGRSEAQERSGDIAMNTCLLCDGRS
jgi:aspartyl/asparaginyl-tRNA synthetase